MVGASGITGSLSPVRGGEGRVALHKNGPLSKNGRWEPLEKGDAARKAAVCPKTGLFSDVFVQSRAGVRVLPRGLGFRRSKPAPRRPSPYPLPEYRAREQ